MKIACSKCGVEKSQSEFHFRRDTERLRNQCKECWKYLTASRRYGVTFEEAKSFYNKPSCMCCGEKFTHKKKQHLHHVDHHVHGILCKYCNLALRQETHEDLMRIESCIRFMSEPRENPFDRVNQQGSRPMDPDPSTTARPAHLRQCKMCDRLLPLNAYYKQKYKSGKYGHYASCKECHKIFVKTYKYGLTFNQVKLLRQTLTCDCCSKELLTPYIHHVGNRVLGVVCNECNILLEQEQDTIKAKLYACHNWMVVIQSGLRGDTQRHAEMTCPTA